jgi:myxalamid-type polyketide synthase MxaE
LWLVTAGAQPAGEGKTTPLASSLGSPPLLFQEGKLNVAQAPLWGLGRVIGLEHPDLGCTCVDMEAGITASGIGALAAEILAGDEEDQIALRNSTRYVPRLAPAQKSLPIRNDTFRVDPQGTYLITGGLGELGLKLATWLADRGARRLVLVGRSGVESSGVRREAVRSLEGRGIEVFIEKVDVADFHRMGEIVERIQSGIAPLRGVIHAAAQIEACTLTEMTHESLMAGLRAKVFGTWVLHELTKTLDLHFFVLFSSTTSLLGSSHLAHYAAANQFLDAMAHYRKALHLPALTINWGIWDEFRSAEALRAPALKQSGLKPMSSSEALAILESLLQTSESQKTVASVDWNILKPAYEARRRRPFLERIAAVPVSKAHSKEPTDLLRQLQQAQPARRRELLTDHIRNEVRTVLGFDAAFVPDPQQGFFEMGMDSLTSVELKSRLEGSLGKSLPTTMALEYPTIHALAGFIEAEVLSPVTVTVTRAADEVVASDREDLDSRSREELLALLAAELTGEEQSPN